MAHWRDTARPVRFFFVDYRATFPILFFIVHIRIWTFLLAVAAMVFFAMVERYGFTVTVFMRWLRAYIAGPRKMAQPWWRRN